MDAENSCSFEDLSNLNDYDVKSAVESVEKDDLSKEQNPNAPNNEKAMEYETNASTVDSGGDSDSPASIVNDKTSDIFGNGQIIKSVIKSAKEQRKPSLGELVTISYTGKLNDTDLIVDKANKIQVHIGDCEVVPGLDMIMPFMDVGEICEVVINPHFAYGSLGLKNDENPELSIPPGATMKYTLELHYRFPEDFADLKSFKLRKQYGAQKRERANFWYNRSEYNTATQLCRRALECLDGRDGDSDSTFIKEGIDFSIFESQSLLDDRLIVYNNLAMAQIKVSDFEAALESVRNVLYCQPNNVKALCRKGKILDAMGDTKGAIALLQKAETLEPDNKIVKLDLEKLLMKVRREECYVKKMYQKMLGQKSKQTQIQPPPISSMLTIFNYIISTILIGAAGLAIYRNK